MVRLGVLLCLTVLAIMGCYKPKEGCIDPGAKNFDATADVPCGNCCQLPTLTLQLRHLLADTNFSSSPIVVDISNTPYQLTKVQFYIYDIELLAADGTIFHVVDSIAVPKSNKKIRNDIQLINNGQFGYTVGSIRVTQPLVGLRFKVGLPDEVQFTEPTDWPVQHPLGLNNLYDAADKQYQTGLVSFNIVGADKQTVAWRLETPHTFNLTFTEPLLLPVGFSAQLSLSLQHGYWLYDADLINDSPTELQEKIRGNMPLVIGG